MGGIVKTAQRRARPGTFLLESGYQVEGEDGLPVAAFSSNVGGMAAHWTGACPRPNDSERIGFLDERGELDELLAEGERLLGVTDRRLRRVAARAARARAAWPPPRTTGATSTSASSGCRSRCTAATTAAWCGRGRTSCSAMRPAATRTSRCTTSRSSRACSSRTAAPPASWSPTCAPARATTCARGSSSSRRDALRTPQLLWASGIRPDALGRYLNDQAQIVFAVRIRDFVPAEGAEGAAQTGLSEYSGVTWVPFTDEMPFHGQVMQLDASPVKLAEDDPAAPGSIVGLGCSARRTCRPPTGSSSPTTRSTATGCRP